MRSSLATRALAKVGSNSRSFVIVSATTETSSIRRELAAVEILSGVELSRTSEIATNRLEATTKEAEGEPSETPVQQNSTVLRTERGRWSEGDRGMVGGGEKRAERSEAEKIEAEFYILLRNKETDAPSVAQRAKLLTQTGARAFHINPEK